MKLDVVDGSHKFNMGYWPKSRKFFDRNVTPVTVRVRALEKLLGMYIWELNIQEGPSAMTSVNTGLWIPHVFYPDQVTGATTLEVNLVDGSNLPDSDAVHGLNGTDHYQCSDELLVMKALQLVMFWLWPRAKKPWLLGFGTKAKAKPKSWPGMAFGLT
ncbi:hypothetical protein B0H11DRAFT_2185513 [Mycena galericulata]|nr:hypothetical protein B0H11DRAFT_2185513 [Mycena galericulata]